MSKDTESKVSPFRHPWWTSFSSVVRNYPTLLEVAIVDISGSIREKPDWNRKYKTPEIADKWKNEIQQEAKKSGTKHIDDIIDYVFEELKWYEWLERNWLLDSYTIGYDDKIVRGDDIVSEETRELLVKQSQELYDLFGNNLDYHPNSDNKVIDLVHPSLFPLQYGLTLLKALQKPVEYVKDDVCCKKSVSWGTSTKFQWLPSLFQYDRDSERYQIKSFINNLHPVKFKPLYDTIEAVFNDCLVGLNYVLSRASSKDYYRGGEPDAYNAYNEEFTKKLDELQDSSNYDDYDEFYETRIEYLKEFIPKWNGPPETTRIDLANDFSQLKVIVKMANIELTPEDPKYNGGSWHVEGAINEDIVATILYYYDMENILESRLAFRAAYEEPNYEQNDDVFLKEVYGLNDEDKLTKPMGSLKAEKGRVVIFPNSFQHQVQPFELVDKSRNGFRKILCFFIVDPYNKVVKTTDDVVPQQSEWHSDSSLKYLFPELLGDNYKSQTLDEAKEHRVQLMSERSIDEEDDDIGFTRLFSLCEH